MRSTRLIPALVALFLSTAASAQVWQEYVNRENDFQINMPAEPTMTETQYRTVKGTMLPARVFTAIAPAGSIFAGTYKVTVVDYSSALNELGDAIEQARNALKAKGTVKYDEVNDLDRHREWRLSIETATTRILASTLLAANNRLYITEGENALNLPPPGQFHVSLQILNQDGVRIRQLTYIEAPEDEIAPISEKANALEAQRLTALVSGTWRNPAGGSCQAAYFKSGERNKTKRNEEAMAGTVTNAGTTIAGQLILAGAREGQFINPTTDKAIFLFENKPNDKLTFTAIGEPAAGWPEVTLELCPGTRSAADAAGGTPPTPIPVSGRPR
jgi:hypothetical protein